MTNLSNLDGKKVQIKVVEYGPELMRQIRKNSGFDEENLI